MASSLRPSKAHEEGPNLGFLARHDMFEATTFDALRSEIGPLVIAEDKWVAGVISPYLKGIPIYLHFATGILGGGTTPTKF